MDYKRYRPEPSPRALDSAFPPFNHDVRFRGVYERAGFDVNKGEYNDQRSIYSPGVRTNSTFSMANSTISPTTSQIYGSTPNLNNKSSFLSYSNPYGTMRNKSAGDVYTRATSRTHSRTDVNTPSRSAGDIYKAGDYKHNDYNPKSADPNHSFNPRNAKDLYNPNLPKTATTCNFQDNKSPRNYSGTTAVSSINDNSPIILKQNTSKADEHDNFDFSPQTSQHKNFMNLSLQLNGDKAMADDSIDPLDADFTDGTVDNDGSDTKLNELSHVTKETSHTSSIRTDELMDSPRKNVNNYGLPSPPKTADNGSGLKHERLSSALDVFKKDIESHKRNNPQSATKSRFSYNQNPSNSSDPSQQFQHFKQQNATDGNNLNVEYQEFLHNRNSNASMVSSIISKESNYSDEDDNDVEEELERQLQSLKTGNEGNIQNNKVDIPTITVDIPETAPRRSPLRETPPESLDLNETIDEVAPLSVGRRELVQEQEPELVQEKEFVQEPKQELVQEPTPLSHKFPPGHGPCRGCNNEISPQAKGDNKAIYTKTGELSGQWHRMCFQCSYDDCNITFNKKVPCYVLEDKAYCDQHYHKLNHSLCEACLTGIEGECIENEEEQKWHLHCLRCNECNCSIESDYYLINDAIFCEFDASAIIQQHKNAMNTNDKVEKRRTRLMHIE